MCLHERRPLGLYSPLHAFSGDVLLTWTQPAAHMDLRLLPQSLPQSHIGNGVAFLNRTLSAKMFSPNANAEGRCGKRWMEWFQAW